MRPKKYLILPVIICAVTLAGPAYSQKEKTSRESPVMVQRDSSLENYLFDLYYYEQQLVALLVDVYRYIGWLSDEKDLMKNDSQRALERLTVISEKASELTVPEEAEDVQRNFLSLLQVFRIACEDLDQKDTRTLKENIAAFHSRFEIYKKSFQKFDLEAMPAPKKPRPIFADDSLQGMYDDAMKLLKEDKYQEAYDKLISLKEKIDKGTYTYDYVLMGLSDALGKALFSEPKKTINGASEKEIIIFSEEVLTKDYSPLFIDLFVRWRTITQLFYHGPGNESEIPNWEYNVKRKELMEKIKKYLSQNPDDTWAKFQSVQLLTLDNISRGGPNGNYALYYVDMLYAPGESGSSK